MYKKGNPKSHTTDFPAMPCAVGFCAPSSSSLNFVRRPWTAYQSHQTCFRSNCLISCFWAIKFWAQPVGLILICQVEFCSTWFLPFDQDNLQASFYTLKSLPRTIRRNNGDDRFFDVFCVVGWEKAKASTKNQLGTFIQFFWPQSVQNPNFLKNVCVIAFLMLYYTLIWWCWRKALSKADFVPLFGSENYFSEVSKWLSKCVYSMPATKARS